MLQQSFWKNRRVLVTGHTGFKGCWLVFWLLSIGAEVWGLSLDSEQSLFTKFDFFGNYVKDLPGKFNHHIGDIRDFATCKELIDTSRPQVVIHLAAQALVRRSFIDPLETWSTNVQGSLNVLEALKDLTEPCAVVMITTDKVYQNNEWDCGYRESDRLGGRDPYSASKAAAELAISSWRSSFCGTSQYQNPHLAIASARAGNVIGGGDLAVDRLIPDTIRALSSNQVVRVRNRFATRPWQHVLEPLGGYLLLAEKLSSDPIRFAQAYNFGPHIESNKTVEEMVDAMLKIWPGKWIESFSDNDPREASKLHLQIDKSFNHLGWKPVWNFDVTVQKTVNWYYKVHKGDSVLSCCASDLNDYQESLSHVN